MNSLNDVWNEVVGVLSKDMTATAVDAWFADCEPVDIDGSTLFILILIALIMGICGMLITEKMD